MIGNEEFPGLAPINFFRVATNLPHIECRKDLANNKKYRFPDTSLLCGTGKGFAILFLGWSKEGLVATVRVNQSYHRSFYPDFIKGDSIEFFIDTRDVKTSGYNTRFCHHFFFLPEAVEGHHAGEITRFRTEEMHQHCDASLLKVTSRLRKDCYEIDIFIPSECLYGYEPDQFDRLGFSYRINRPDGPSQYFSALGDEYKVEEQPSLWSSLRLVT